MKEGEPQVAEESAAFGEGERVAEERPGDADKAKSDVGHHHGIEGVFCSDHAAVEESEGRRHHQHHRGGDQHPCGVGRAQGRHGHRLYHFLIPSAIADCGPTALRTAD